MHIIAFTSKVGDVGIHGFKGILISLLLVLPVVVNVVSEQPSVMMDGEVTMSTDKECYEPGELVNITATGNTEVRMIGDFPERFWAITNESGGPVYETWNMLDAILLFNGSKSGIWNQTYRLLPHHMNSSGPQVPLGEYTIWFHEIPTSNYSLLWHPTKISIRASCPEGLAVDAGPDQTVNEGDAVQYNGSARGGGGSGYWVARKNIPSPRAGGGAAALGGEIYYAGGNFSDLTPDPSKVFQKYNPATDTWTSLPDLPEPRVFLGVAAAKGKIFAIGGSEGRLTVDTTFAFDPATNSWSSMGRMPVAMEAFGIATVNDYIYIIGGRSTFLNCTFCPSVFRFDPTTSIYTSMTDMPTERSFLAATALNGLIYAIGGRNYGVGAPLEVFNPTTDSWAVKTSLSVYREALSAEAIGGKVYAFGGTIGADMASNDTYIYDPATDTWSTGASMLNLRMHFGSGAIGNCIYAVGGMRGFMAGFPNASEEYCLGGELTYTWDFDASVDSDGDGDYTNDVDATGAKPSHVYGDNGIYVATLTVKDSSGDSASDTVNITVLNVAPSIAYTVVPTGNEADTLIFTAQVTDPGSDDIEVAWSGSCTGWSPPTMYPNDPTIFPDPYPSPEVNPRDVTDTQTVVCGDNGVFVWDLKAEDDDGGVTTLNGTFSVMNIPPTYPPTFCPQIVGCNSTRYEGANTDYWVAAVDNGSDDLTFDWTWGDGSPPESGTHFNNGVSPDPPNSPDGTYPFFADEVRWHAFGDDGTYLISVSTQDDDGGSSPIIAEVTVLNLPPSLSVPPPLVVNVDEGSHVTLAATAIDPGSDDLTFTWTWDYGPTYATTFYNNGVSPDPPDSPLGTFPFTATDSSSHTYGDDCPCEVSLIVEDDDGGSLTYTTTVNVLNVPPSVVGDVEAYAKGSLILRVAGEKYHDVKATVYLNGVEKYTATVVRMPGSPDAQAVTLGNVTIDLLRTDTWNATLVYTPLDDPINGRVWGATPAWLIFRSEHGNDSRIHHTFNARHEDTWIWDVPDLRAMLIGIPINFKATATDPGSDDLTFAWDWGDGSSPTATIYYNDGVGPDSYPSPDGIFPFTANDSQTHVYAAAGTYTIILTVTDDDGGSYEIPIAIIL